MAVRSVSIKCCFAMCSTRSGSKVQPQNRQMIKYWKDRTSAKESKEYGARSLKGRGNQEVRDVLIADNAGVEMLEFDISCALIRYYCKEVRNVEADAIWDELWYSWYVPDIEVIKEVFNVHGGTGIFGEIVGILRRLKCRGFDALVSKPYSVAICCFGRLGEIELMKSVLKEMKLEGLAMDSRTENKFLVSYSVFRTLSEVEGAYECVKRSGILVESEGIRAIKKRKCYKLGEFTKDVCLGRRNSGNLLWNLLFLSYAVNIRMKSLQREFLNMVGAGFRPDITTFNIRALAYSKNVLILGSPSLLRTHEA